MHGHGELELTAMASAVTAAIWLYLVTPNVAARWDRKRGPWRSCWWVELGGGAMWAVNRGGALCHRQLRQRERERGRVREREREPQHDASPHPSACVGEVGVSVGHGGHVARVAQGRSTTTAISNWQGYRLKLPSLPTSNSQTNSRFDQPIAPLCRATEYYNNA